MSRAFEAKTFEEERAAFLKKCSEQSLTFHKKFAQRLQLERHLGRASTQLLRDGDVALACISIKSELLAQFDESLLADKSFMLSSVSQSGLTLEHASEEIKEDREVVLRAVCQNGLALRFASADLRQDKEVVLAAVKACGPALEFASEDLRDDKEVVLAAVGSSGFGLQFASEPLRNDRTVVLTAVSKNGPVLQSLDEALRGDKEVVLVAAKTCALALRFASPELRNDKDFVLLFFRNVSAPHRTICYNEAGQSVKEVLSMDDLNLAAESFLSTPGQAKAAPMLTVTLTKHATEEEDEGCFRAEGLLLSGEELVCDLAVESRAEPVLNDLARKFTEELEKKVGTPCRYVFLTFNKHDAEGPLAATPWDHVRPLSEFLC